MLGLNTTKWTIYNKEENTPNKTTRNKQWEEQARILHASFVILKTTFSSPMT